jgi:hypothetical protein
MYNSSKLVDGLALTSGTSNSYTTDWVDVRSYPYFSMSVVFTGGSPQGTAKLQSSNDRLFAGGNYVRPLASVPAENSNGVVKVVSDAADVASGNGANTVSVTAAGVYLLDQRLAPFGWVRMVYTASSNVNSQLDVFLTLKSDK